MASLSAPDGTIAAAAVGPADPDPLFTNFGCSTAAWALPTAGSIRGQTATLKAPTMAPATRPLAAFNRIGIHCLLSLPFAPPLHQTVVETVRILRAGASIRECGGFGCGAERVERGIRRARVKINPGLRRAEARPGGRRGEIDLAPALVLVGAEQFV